MGMSLATGAMAGQFVGAGMPEKTEETVKRSSLLTFGVITIISIFLFFFGQHVTKIFIDDTAVIAVGKQFFNYGSFSLPFFVTMEVFIGTLRGTGHTVQSTIVDMVRLWVIRIPLIFFFADLFGYVGIFYAMIISNISTMCLAYVFPRLGNWKEKVVEEYAY